MSEEEIAIELTKIWISNKNVNDMDFSYNDILERYKYFLRGIKNE